jgi:hypothetical protein
MVTNDSIKNSYRVVTAKFADGVELPTSFTALTRNRYAVFERSPVTERVVLVETVFVTVVHDVPPLVEYSTR